MDLKPKKFINESIEPGFDQPPALEKMPGPPNRFSWRGEVYEVAEILMEWHDYRRRGRMARNMQPQHASHAERRGSWGVGQDYYRVRTGQGRIFDIYYDRAPLDADRHSAGWFIDRELQE